MYDQSAHWVNEIRFFRIQDSRNRQQDIWRIFGRVCSMLFKQELQLPDDAWNYYAYL